MSGAGSALVRDGRAEDVGAVHRMIQELAEFEGFPDGPQLSVQDLIQDGFEAQPPWFFLVVAERAGELVGYALCNRAYSSWTRQAFYMEDLYVRKAERGRGLGGRLMRAVCSRAAREGGKRLDWHVLADNDRAVSFYRGMGAVDMRVSEGHAALRLSAEHIQRLAREHEAGIGGDC